jgi:hypothetical protein
VIRDVVLHMNNEQPLLADLFEAPSPGDVGLRCTNLRTMNGKRPVFVDDSASIFFFPYLHIRFVEIPPGAISGIDRSSRWPPMPTARLSSARAEPAGEPEAEPALDEDLEIDEDFLRRVREAEPSAPYGAPLEPRRATPSDNRPIQDPVLHSRPCPRTL